MKFILLFLLALVAICKAEECLDEKAEVCIVKLIAAAMDEDTSKEEACVHLESTIDCLKTAVNECGEELNEEEEKGLRDLDEILKDECSGSIEEKENEESEDSEDNEEDSNEMHKCLDQNEEYVLECIYDTTIKVLEELIESEEHPSDAEMECGLYISIATCMVARIGEKCGNEAKDAAIQDFLDVPEDISKACEASGIPESAMFG